MLKVYDDFLSENDFKLVQDTLLSKEIPWRWSQNIASGNDPPEKDNFQFVHALCSNNIVASNYMEFLEPLTRRLTAKSYVRVKANLRPRTSEIVKSSWHVDTTELCKTAIFYVNSTNGCTVFKGGTEVKGIENRLLLFDSHIEHAGTSCTDELRRVVLNINYHPVKMNGKEQLPL